VILAIGATWFLPGLGHSLAGRWRRGATYFIAVFGLLTVAYFLFGHRNLALVGMGVCIAAQIVVLIAIADAIWAAWRAPMMFPRWVLPQILLGVAFLATLFWAPADPMMRFVRGTINHRGDAYSISTVSMAPAIKAHDHVWVSFHQRIERWSIVALHLPAGRQNVRRPIYLKRVVGLPGETVRIREGIIHINGKAVTAPASMGKVNDQPLMQWKKSGVDQPIHLGADEYFVLGDNTANSYDSRYFQPYLGHQAGAVPASEILGRAAAIYWPLARIHQFNH
jgi:signal peptidase I